MLLKDNSSPITAPEESQQMPYYWGTVVNRKSPEESQYYITLSEKSQYYITLSEKSQYVSHYPRRHDTKIRSQRVNQYMSHRKGKLSPHHTTVTKGKPEVTIPLKYNHI